MRHGPCERQRGINARHRRRSGPILDIGVPVETGLDGQHGRPALFLRQQTMQPMYGQNAFRAGSVSDAASILERSFNSGSEVEFHRIRTS